jgi:hypothetical protein
MTGSDSSKVLYDAITVSQNMNTSATVECPDSRHVIAWAIGNMTLIAIESIDLKLPLQKLPSRK